MSTNKNCHPSALFEVGDIETYKARLSVLLKCDSLLTLTIQISSNKGWVVFSNTQGLNDHSFSYDYETKLISLPDEFGNLKNLKYLTISYLGIDNLPDSLFGLVKLQSLDISFNRIELSKELNGILALSDLNVLKIYGCSFSDSDIRLIQRQRPDLKVLYTEKHLIEELKENRN